MIIKLRSERRGAHVHERVFVGPDTDHLALAGVLIFDVGEWQAFGAALGLGALQMRGQVRIVFEGDEEVVGSPTEAGREDPRTPTIGLQQSQLER